MVNDPPQDFPCLACGETNPLAWDSLVDDFLGRQDWVQDCWVCCRPHRLLLETEDDTTGRRWDLRVYLDNEE